jgi:peptide/nickel transport system substrate-binding protein
MPRRASAASSPRTLRQLCALCVQSFLLLFVLAGCGHRNTNDPDVFEFVFSSKRFPPDGANRGHYRNLRINALVDQMRTEPDREKRKALCSGVQKILAVDLPYLPLWFTDVVSVHRRSLGELQLSPRRL